MVAFGVIMSFMRQFFAVRPGNFSANFRSSTLKVDRPGADDLVVVHGRQDLNVG